MNKKFFASKCIMIMGILTFLLGIIHNFAAYSVFRTGSQVLAQALTKDNLMVFIYFFVAIGITLNFVGILSIYSSFHINKSEKWAWVIALSIGIFQFILGIGSILAMYSNPFAYVFMSLGLFEILPLVILKKELFKI